MQYAQQRDPGIPVIRYLAVGCVCPKGVGKRTFTESRSSQWRLGHTHGRHYAYAYAKRECRSRYRGDGM